MIKNKEEILKKQERLKEIAKQLANLKSERDEIEIDIVEYKEDINALCEWESQVSTSSPVGFKYGNIHSTN